jgi:hypothetical protein
MPWAARTTARDPMPPPSFIAMILLLIPTTHADPAEKAEIHRKLAESRSHFRAHVSGGLAR